MNNDCNDDTDNMINKKNNNSNMNMRMKNKLMGIDILIPILIIIFIVIILWMWNKWFQSKDDDKIKPKIEEEFVITFNPKNSHPWLKLGSPSGYSINSQEGATLHLHRGRPYRFTFASPNLHPLYFTTCEIGNNSKSQIKNSPIFDKAESKIIIFDHNYPNKLYYQSLTDSYMGGIIHLK